MQKQLPISTLLCGLSLFSQAQAHVHGVGKMLVVQQQHQWQIQFELPASDALGFERADNSPEQAQAIAKLIERMQHSEQLVTLGPECGLIQSDYHLPALNEASEEEEEEESSHEDHEDIDVQYLFSCEQPNIQLHVTLFDWMPSLQRIDLQWANTQGQGQANLTPANPAFIW